MDTQKSTILKDAINTQQSAWQQLVEHARSRIDAGDWEGACVFYKQAFVIAEDLLCKHNCGQCCALNRYLDTAEEFAFVLKKNNFDCALALFASQITNNIEEQAISLSDTELTQRLSSLTTSPKQVLAMSYNDIN